MCYISYVERFWHNEKRRMDIINTFLRELFPLGIKINCVNYYTH